MTRRRWHVRFSFLFVFIFRRPFTAFFMRVVKGVWRRKSPFCWSIKLETSRPQRPEYGRSSLGLQGSGPRRPLTHLLSGCPLRSVDYGPLGPSIPPSPSPTYSLSPAAVLKAASMPTIIHCLQVLFVCMYAHFIGLRALHHH